MKIDACIEEIKVLAEKAGRPVQFMEVCGTHTMAAFRTGLRSLLPDTVKLFPFGAGLSRVISEVPSFLLIKTTTI